MALLLAAAGCSQRYELNLPLALNRTEMRFDASGNSYYVMVYCQGAWTARLDKEVPWVELSRTEGVGNSQIMVSADLNRGVSRGVTLLVTGAAGTKEMYISQTSGNSEAGNYSLVKEGIEMLRGASTGRIAAGTDLDEETLSRVETSVEYDQEDLQPWIHDIQVSASRVTFQVDENTSGEPRSATVYLSFPLARWDTPVQAFFTVSQSVAEPAEIPASLLPLDDGTQPVWADGDRLLLLDSDGSNTFPAEVNTFNGATATLLFNADAVRSGVLGGVYPEDYVSRWSGGKVYVHLPENQPYVSSPALAGQLALVAGKKVGDALQLGGACALLRLNLQGEGTLQQLSVLAGSPLSGDGTIDMAQDRPAYVPGSDGSPQITVNIPAQGIALPAQLYVAVPAGDLGSLLVSAVTSTWSGCVSGAPQAAGTAGGVIALEELSFSLPAQATDLTQGSKWANCFVVDGMEEALYSVEIRRPDGTLPASDISRCSILWQTAPGVLDYLAIDPASSKLYFRKSADNPGSAHVAVISGDGVIRWSYHIWAPATPVEERVIGSWTFMDRNVGAVKADARDYSNASIGMHYQWGRKDPFPPAKATAANGNGMRAKVYPDNIVFVTAQDGVSQEVADATPNTYYWGSGASGKQDWRDVQDDALWASATSNANPCPYGWMVPSNDALGVIPERLKAAEYVSKVGITIQDDNGKEMLFVPGGAYRRSTSTASELANMSDGWIWSSTPFDITPYRGSYRLWYQSNVNNRRIDSTYPHRRWGGNVRCVKVQ